MKKLLIRTLSFLCIVTSLYGQIAAADGSDDFTKIKALIDELALETALSEMKTLSASNVISDAELNILTAMFFAESGHPGKALTIIEKTKYMTTQFESELAEAQARSFFKQGDFAKADNFSIEALKANPNNLGAQLIAIKISGELSGSLQDKSFEDLIQSSNHNKSVWLAYLEQALRFDPNNTELADRAYIELGDTGIMTEYRGRFAFLGGDPYDAHRLFQDAQALFRAEGNTISANRIGRWLKIHKKFAKRPPPSKPENDSSASSPKAEIQREEPKLKRDNLPGPGLTPASQNNEIEIEPINIETEGDIFTGSGFITNNGQWIITNRHVIERADRAVVRDGLGKVRYVKEFYLDKDQDIALLILHEPFPASQAIPPADIIDPVGGDELFLMGYPLADVLGAHHPSITEGIVSKEAGFRNEASEFLITANLNRGNSGGPIFSVDGRVLGIAVAKLDKTKFLKENNSIPEDINIGIQGKEVRRFLGFKHSPTSDARPIMSARDAYSSLRSKVVLVVAIDE